MPGVGFDIPVLKSVASRWHIRETASAARIQPARAGAHSTPATALAAVITTSVVVC